MTPPIKRRKRGWMPLRVSQIHRETHDTVRIHLEDAEESGRQFDYDAGQYLTFRFDDLSSKPVVRSYTLSSSPEQVSDVAFTVKKVDDGFVSKFLVDDLKEGDVLRARGPIGKFCFDEAKHLKNRFMIAAGSGVTPFLSMIRSAIASGFVGELGLLVSFKTDRDLIAWDELSAWQDKGKLKLHCSLSRQEKEGFLQGRVSTEKIETLCKSWLGDTTFFTCGPDAMMESAKSTLLDMGLEEEQFEMESFS